MKNQLKSDQVIYMPGPSILHKMKKIRKAVRKSLCEQKSGSAAEAAAYKPVQKHKKLLLAYWGDLITYPFLNFNSATDEVLEWISNSIPHIIMDAIICPCWD